MIKCQGGHIVQGRRACVLFGTGKGIQLIRKCLHKQMMSKKKTQLERGCESSGMNHPHERAWQPWNKRFSQPGRSADNEEEPHTWTGFTRAKASWQMDRPRCPLPFSEEATEFLQLFWDPGLSCFPFKRGQSGEGALSDCAGICHFLSPWLATGTTERSNPAPPSHLSEGLPPGASCFLLFWQLSTVYS